MQSADSTDPNKLKNKLIVASIILCCAVLFSLLTVFVQVRELGLSYLERDQLGRHMNVLRGEAGNAWQYRILSTILSSGLSVD